MQKKSKERIFSKSSVGLFICGRKRINGKDMRQKMQSFVLFNIVLLLLMWFVGYGGFMRDLKFFSARLRAEPKPGLAILMILY